MDATTVGLISHCQRTGRGAKVANLIVRIVQMFKYSSSSNLNKFKYYTPTSLSPLTTLDSRSNVPSFARELVDAEFVGASK